MDENNPVNQGGREEQKLQKLESELGELEKKAAGQSQPGPAESQPSPPSPPTEPAPPPASPEPTPPSTGKSKIVIWVGLGFLILALVAIGTYYVSSRRATPTITAIPSPISAPTSTPDPTVNWKTYTNDFDKYSAKYPSNWYLNPASAEGNGTDIADSDISNFAEVPNPDDTEHIRVNIIAFNNESEMPLQKWLEENDTEQIYSEDTITVAEITGVLREESNSDFLQLPEIKSAIAIYLPYRNKVYRILAFPSDSKHKEILDQILSTFKFIEATPSATMTP